MPSRAADTGVISPRLQNLIVRPRSIPLSSPYCFGGTAMNIIKIIAFALLILSPSIAEANEVFTLRPQSSKEQVSFAIPMGWHGEAGTRMSIGTWQTDRYEYYPEGQSARGWNERLVVSMTDRHEAVAPGTRRKLAANSLLAFNQDFCINPIKKDSADGFRQNNYEFSFINARCAVRPDMKQIFPGVESRKNTEAVMGGVMEGMTATYEFKWEWRSDNVTYSENKKQFVGPASEVNSLNIAMRDGFRMLSTIWPCDPSRPDRSCTRPHQK